MVQVPGNVPGICTRLEGRCNMNTNIVWHSGQRVVTRAGDVVTIAYIRPDGSVMGWRAGYAVPVLVRPVSDAFGGEHDAALMNAA